MTDLEIEQLGTIIRNSRLSQFLGKSMRPADFVHTEQKDALYDFEVDLELEKGMKTALQAIKDIREWRNYLEKVKKEADRIANEATKLS